jgi:NAD(P) transhydrogenase subunit alpha
VQVHIEAECGHTASFHDDDYSDVTVLDSFADVVREADIVVKVLCPTIEEIVLLPPGTILICIMSAFQHVEEIQALRERRITVLAMDHLPRTTRAQPLDALSSQATVAGYKAALLAAELSPRLFPMLTTAAGTIRPSRVLVIGAGVAGLQAIATSRRLGAQVEAYDIRKAAKEQIESLGARMVDTGVEVEGAGGLARALRKDEKQKQHDVLAKHLAKAHVVICAASIPGRHAPRIISEDMVDGMLPESVIVDLAASTGGNCELTRIGEHYHHNETLIVGPLNLPSHGAVHASEMYARNVHNMLQLIIEDQEAVLNPEDEIIARCVVCHDGQINHGPTAVLLEVEHEIFGGMVHSALELPDQTSGWLQDAEGPLDEDIDQAGTTSSSQGTTTEERSADVSQSDDAFSDHALCESGEPDEIAKDPSSIGNQSASDHKAGILESAVNPEPGVAEPLLQELAPESSLESASIENHAFVDNANDNSSADNDLQLSSDDLTLINGVGPALQERLYAFGYRRWEHLAKLDAESAKKLAIQLELTGEIEEQSWIEQARQLMETIR